MSEAHRVAVVGCGVFGAVTALRLAEEGHRVTVFERARRPLSQASFNNQNRLHLGFHYPRDRTTAEQCVRGYQRFREEFAPCVVTDFPNGYFVAEEGSAVTPRQYLDFCDAVGLRYQRVEPADYRPPVTGVALGLLTEEAVIDCGQLRDLLTARLADSTVTVRLGTDVREVVERGDRYLLRTDEGDAGTFDSVVNCGFADINRLNRQLGHPAPERQYEYTAVLVVEWDHPPVGVTVMDGRFTTLLPFGRSGHFLLYHVEHSVLDRVTARVAPTRWRGREPEDLVREDLEGRFRRMLGEATRFVPSLGTARLRDVLHGPRVVLAHRDDTDARPSMVNTPGPGYVTVFSGKLDHSVWAADEVVRRVRERAA
ncbi:FAD-dependent oxidoreductase [Streptomyces sp. NPDC005438]|uniref:FAD-dependent oxidoreductase n=1 Tax=Streptomyces sp. NPDC005438 TaxID=3156880 RepID=UPI0033BC6742